MDRSVAGRVGIGRPFGMFNRRRPARVETPRGTAGRPGQRTRHRRVASSRLAGWARNGWSLIQHHRRLRIALLAVVTCSALLIGGWLWLRDSPLVAVERVQVVGVHGPEAGAIDQALTSAARQMSTLDVHPQRLLAAVAPYQVVRAVAASPSFPHGLRIRVVEQLPVAALTIAGGRTAVAADGVVLGPALLSGALPVLSGGSGRQTVAQDAGQHVRDASLLACLTVLGAAPAPLAGQIVRAFTGPDGVTVVMRGGLRVYFGDSSRPHAKWLSLASVLADRSSAGATYVDVRVAERPAAGLPGTVASETGTAGAPAGGAPVLTTTSELAASLAAALPSSPPSGASTSTGSSPTETTPSGPAQSGSGTQSEAPGAPDGEASTTGSTPGG